jgi:Holliday junction resolvase
VANRSGAKGSLFERQVLTYLREAGKDAERLARAGSLDEGDLVIRLTSGLYVAELKAEARMNLPGALREVEVERVNYGKARGLKEAPPGVAIIKSPGKPIGKSFVVQHLEDWLAIH